MIDRACISLGNACNLKCRYCHFQDKQFDFKSFNWGELKIIVDNIHDYCKDNGLSSFKLGIVGAGEPLLKKEELFSLLECIKNSSYEEFKAYTISNGTLFDEAAVQKFYEYKDVIKLCISLDGYKELHNAGRDKFDKVMQAIELYRKTFGNVPSINATVNKLSYLNKEKLVDFFLANGLKDVTFSKLVGYSEKDLYITDAEYQEFLEYIKERGLFTRQFRSEKKYDCTMYGALCGVGRTNIFYTPEGIYPCGRFYKNDRYKLGESIEKLSKIEKEMERLTPVCDGKCYYQVHVEGIR